MNGPWTVPLVTLEFVDPDTGNLLLTRHSYHVLREGDIVDLNDGPDRAGCTGKVVGVIWRDEIVTVYVEQPS